MKFILVLDDVAPKDDEMRMVSPDLIAVSPFLEKDTPGFRADLHAGRGLSSILHVHPADLQALPCSVH